MGGEHGFDIVFNGYPVTSFLSFNHTSFYTIAFDILDAVKSFVFAQGGE